MAKKIRKSKQFPEKFRTELVKLVLDEGQNVSDLCKKHELHKSALYSWLRKERLDRGAEHPRRTVPKSKIEKSITEKALCELKKECTRQKCTELKAERDFYKQTAMVFQKIMRLAGLLN